MPQQTLQLDVTIQVFWKRCDVCNRYYGTEDQRPWRCVSCEHDRNLELQGEVEQLNRTIRGLRSALTRFLKKGRTR